MKQQIRIIIVGYYNHDNLGDEQYKETFEYMLDKYLPLKRYYEIKFIDCDTLHNEFFEDTDIIFLGGGDVLNFYFIDKIYEIFHNKPNKIIAVSVGLPYADILINTNKLNIIDYIFIRTQKDIKLFSKYFIKERIIYLPDISFYISKSVFLKKYGNKNNSSRKKLLAQRYSRKLTIEDRNLSIRNLSIRNLSILEDDDKMMNIINKIKNQDKKIIAFSLSRHIYNKQHPEYYQQIIQELSIFICFLSKSGYYIILLPFNTSNHILDRDQNLENDIYIQEDVFNIIQNKTPLLCDNVLNIDFTLSTKDVLEIFDYVHISIPMRFHACLFSIYKRIPILPLFTQKKIRNLLLDIQWVHFYELPKNPKDIPTNICQLSLQEKFQNLLANFHSERELLNITCNNLEQQLQKSVPLLISTIQTSYPKINTVINLSDIKVLALWNKLQYIVNERGYTDFRLVDELDLKENLVNVVNFFITGDFDSCYSYGLMEKMFNLSFNYNDEWKWIINDWQENHSENNEQYSNPNGLFNIHYMPQADKSGAHRSGWQYVYNDVAKLHNDTSSLYLDLYLDRTFHWKKNVLKMVDIIPYRNPWMGFIHHTFDQTFSTYNNVVMFQDPDFIISLQYCKGIFVLSDYLKIQIEDIFSKKKLNIPVYSVMHPTETENIPLFTFQKFLDNPDKKIVHIGGWLRNIFSFYQLNIPTELSFAYPKRTFLERFFSFFTYFSSSSSNTYKIRKVALKGKGMNNYYPTDTFLSSLSQCKISEPNIEKCDKNCSQNNMELKNNWHKHFYENVLSVCNSVDIIEKISNKEYDELLSQNIVFIHLVDASTVNTVLECIARNTPIIVNKHPATIELLGSDYPLFFNANDNSYYEISKEIEKLLENKYKIYLAFVHLCNLNKKELKISEFSTKLSKKIK
jgi:polysaccharide pyruvyl transferase WcaK-like protein